MCIPCMRASFVRMCMRREYCDLNWRRKQANALSEPRLICLAQNRTNVSLFASLFPFSEYTQRTSGNIQYICTKLHTQTHTRTHSIASFHLAHSLLLLAYGPPFAHSVWFTQWNKTHMKLKRNNARRYRNSFFFSLQTCIFFLCSSRSSSVTIMYICAILWVFNVRCMRVCSVCKGLADWKLPYATL